MGCKQIRLGALCAVLSLVALISGCSRHIEGASHPDESTLLPTGKRITPLAVPGSHFDLLNPELKEFPEYVAGQAMSSTISPDGKTLLILTSGFNRVHGEDGKLVPAASQEYVFVYDIAAGMPRKIQVLRVPNTFAGITFSPSGEDFYVSGGTDDNLHTYRLASNGEWGENGEAIKLGHSSGLGFFVGRSR
jgi:hypothetical protein